MTTPRRSRTALAPLEQETWDDGSVVSYMASPFPHERKPIVPVRMHRDARVGTVDLDKLIGTQRRVTQHGVDKYMSAPTSGELPIVYRSSSGKDYVADGHHRLVAAYLSGKRRAKANIVDIGDLDK